MVLAAVTYFVNLPMLRQTLTGLFCIALACTLQAQDSTLQVMTFNIRYDNPADGENNWHLRKADMVASINMWQPAVLGIQEGLFHQVQFLDSALTQYAYVGVGRDDGKQAGEYSAIFYDTSKVTLIQDTTFWLSMTPEKPSTGWDAALPRICTAAQFFTVGQQETFWVFNTHFDHVGALAREWSTRIIVYYASELNPEFNYQMIIMGDFNSTPEDKPYQMMTESKVFEDTRLISYYDPTGPEITFNGFAMLEALESPRIDYIFVYHFKTIAQSHILAIREGGLAWLSDHFPVSANLKFVH